MTLFSIIIVTIISIGVLQYFELSEQKPIKPKFRTLKDHPGKALAGSIEVVNEFGEKGLLSDYIKTPTILYRFSESNCSLCYEAHLELFKTNSYFGLEESLIIVTASNNERYLYFLRNSKQLSKKIRLLQTQTLPLDYLNKPYMIVVDKGMEIREFYIPDAKLDGLSKICKTWRSRYRNND